MNGFKIGFEGHQILGGIEDGSTSILITDKNKLHINFGSLTSDGMTSFTWYSADLHIGDTFTIQFLNITETTAPQDTLIYNDSKSHLEIDLDFYRKLKQELIDESVLTDTFSNKNRQFMHGLKIYHNNKKLEVAIKDGMLFFNLFSYHGGNELNICGTNYIKHEKYIWKSSSIALGDKIKIEVAEINEPSAPTKIIKDKAIVQPKTKQEILRELEEKLKREGLI